MTDTMELDDEAEDRHLDFVISAREFCEVMMALTERRTLVAFLQAAVRRGDSEAGFSAEDAEHEMNETLAAISSITDKLAAAAGLDVDQIKKEAKEIAEQAVAEIESREAQAIGRIN